MGREKEDRIEAEDGWVAKAWREGLSCPMCGTTIPYCDRDTYLEHGTCHPCHANVQKDD
jgi:hypothetical protein